MMSRARASRWAGALAILMLASGCASFQARGAFTRGQKARDRGDIAPAIASFEEAVRRDPGKPEYLDALKGARAEAARAEADKAVAAEARGDFPGAARHWSAAARHEPNNPTYSARQTLAELDGRQADPVQVYAVASKLAQTAPRDPVVQRKLQTSKKGALEYHLRMARMYAEARSWTQAEQAYAAAHEIDPKHPAFRGAAYREARVQHYEAVGDQKQAEGDLLGAYEAYGQAVTLRPSSRLRRKLARAKRGAGPVLEQMGQAEAYAKANQWEDAAEIYSAISGRADAPAEVRTAATEARAKSAKVRSDRAVAYAQRNMVDKAVAELRLALEHSDGSIDALKHMDTAVGSLEQEKLHLAKPEVDAARRLAATLPVVVAAPTVMDKMAGRLFARAQAGATRDPATAMVLLSRLQTFSEVLPGYDRVKKNLLKKAFGRLLERAEAEAEAGRFDAASEQLSSALSLARPPEALAAPLSKGCKALEARDWVRARAEFGAAVAQSQRSRLAKAGLKVADAGRLYALRREAREARAVDDVLRATTAYRGIVEIAPGDEEATLALDELKAEVVQGALQSAALHRDADRIGAAFVYYHRVLMLDPDEGTAKAAMAQLQPKLGTEAAPAAYVAPLERGVTLKDACRGVEKAARDRIALYLNKTPDLGVSFLEGAEADKVDKREAAAPPVELRGSVNTCQTSKTGGKLVLQLELQTGGRSVFAQAFSADFDPSSVPKDELEDGLPPRKVVNELLGKVAKAVSAKVKADAAKLSGWRVVAAKDRMQAGDAEGAARAYAALVRSRDALSSDERGALEELERYLNNRYR